MAQRKQSTRSVKPRTRTKALTKGATATDVTTQSPDMVIGQVKLLCDNDTNVVFFRQSGRLFMTLVPRT